MKRLILLRHAAAAWAGSGLEDRDRPLTDVGRTECVRQAAWLTDHALTPQHVIVSSALRARQTWELMRENLSPSPAQEFQDDLYLAEPGTLLARIETLPDAAQTAMVVAHNPGLEVLARMLAGPAPDAAAMRDMTLGIPTAGISVFTVNAEHWEQVTVVDTRLTDFARPGDVDD